MYEVSHVGIKQLAEEDRPREKFFRTGKRSMSNSELLAILLGSGNRHESALELAKRLLSKYDNDLRKLSKATLNDLQTLKGIGRVKAVNIFAALELGKRYEQSPVSEKTKINGSRDVYEMALPLVGDLPYEEFWVLFLNRANRLVRAEKISTGGLSGTVADLRIIFRKAIDHLASGVILVHNHPSGNRYPSKSDQLLTKRACEAGQLLDIVVLDHIIVTEKGYYSFADEGEL